MHGRSRRARAHGVRSNAASGVFHRDDHREVHDRGLGRTIDAESAVAAEGAFRARADNRPAAALDHFRQGEFRREKHAHEIHFPQPPGVRFGEFRGFDASRAENAGVVVENVDAPIGLDRLGDDAFGVFRLADVGANEDDLAAVRLDVLGDRLARRNVDVAS